MATCVVKCALRQFLVALPHESNYVFYFFIFLFFISIGYADNQTIAGEVNVDVFLASTCPHCHAADNFLADAEKKNPWLIVHRYIIDQDKKGLQRFYEHLQQQHANDFSVPSFFFCGSRWIGFGSILESGSSLQKGLTYCHRYGKIKGALDPGVTQLLQQWALGAQHESSTSKSASVRGFIPSAAVMDAFSSCSLFCLMLLFASFALSPARFRSQTCVALVLIAALCFMHYLHYAYSTIYYQYVNRARIMDATVGVLLLLYVVYHWRNQSRQGTMKRFILPLVIVVLTSLAVYSNQETCALGGAIDFQQWLVAGDFSSSERVVYQIVYQLFYALPMLVFLLMYRLYFRGARVLRYQSVLRLWSYLILITISLLLIITPSLLAEGLLSWIVLVISLLLGYIMHVLSRART